MKYCIMLILINPGGWGEPNSNDFVHAGSPAANRRSAEGAQATNLNVKVDTSLDGGGGSPQCAIAMHAASAMHVTSGHMGAAADLLRTEHSQA